ncbi:MAG: AmmeMemoRadiSam system radical SAM enzyme [Eubacteriales bacterium]|nr:AmmeMemoRadiSam system radical SAM enzyme [Eubacteriales bacterium]
MLSQADSVLNDLHEARYYICHPDCMVECQLCPHYCRIKPGQTGRCLGRLNLGGKLYAASYGQLSSVALDPIEKKPLRRFFPGSTILSVGAYGCNLNCEFCQNWHIALKHVATEYYAPEELVDLAIAEKSNGNIGLAFTYNEPLITFEYVLDTCKLAKAAGLQTVLVTNGMINPDPMKELLPYVDAMNIDLKAFRPLFYHKICRGELEAVKRTIKLSVPVCHVEITTLLIPGLNDEDAEIEAAAKWIASIDRLIPYHLTRHHPAYRMLQPGPIALDRMDHLAAIARHHLSDVGLGNI